MRSHGVATLVFAAVLGSAAAVTYSEAGCQVMGANEEVLDCSGKHTGGGLTSVPTGIPSTVVHVWLSHNQITHITATDFAGLRHMKYLYLDNNLITSVDVGAFNDLNSLIFLLLNNNAITELLDDSFSRLVNLEALDMRANAINTLRPSMFNGLINLVYLNLYGNSIRQIGCGTFNMVSTIGYINMASNPSTCAVNERSTGLLSCSCDTATSGGFGYCSGEDNLQCGALPPVLEGYANADTTAVPALAADGSLVPLSSDRFLPAVDVIEDVTSEGNSGTEGTQAQASDNTGVMLAGLIGGMAVLVAAVGVAVNARSQSGAKKSANIAESKLDLQWDDGATAQVNQWQAGSIADDTTSVVSTSIMHRTMDNSKWQGSMWNLDGAGLTVPQSGLGRPSLSHASSVTELAM
eukprot:m.11162 g.11162  ORF g.11162 m.11162 type:complete len:408 (-) comp7292_c0_seq2:165-1388(-)